MVQGLLLTVVGLAAVAIGRLSFLAFGRGIFGARAVRVALGGGRDEATEPLSDPRQADAPALESLLSLGAYLRRSGECERAIRLHQDLLTLSRAADSQRLRVRLELARDFEQAGLWDPAIEAVRAVLEAQPAHDEALVLLGALFGRKADWARAAEAEARRVRAGNGSKAAVARHLVMAAQTEADPELAAAFAARAAELD